MIVHHFKTVAVRTDLKGPLFASWCTCQEKVILIIASERGARIKFKTSRTVLVITQRRSKPSRLLFVPRLVHEIVIPWIVVFLKILPVRSPTGLEILLDVDEPFIFPRVVSIVIDAKKVSVLIKSNLLNITLTVSKHFKIGTIELTTHQPTLIRKAVVTTIRRFDTNPLVSHRPVYPSVRPDPKPVHVVARIGEMNPKP